MKGPKTSTQPLGGGICSHVLPNASATDIFIYNNAQICKLGCRHEYAIQKDSSQSLCKLRESRCNQSDQENRYKGPWQTSTTCARRPHGLTGAFAKRLPSVFGNMTGGHASITMERWPGTVEHRHQSIVEFVGMPCLVR